MLPVRLIVLSITISVAWCSLWSTFEGFTREEAIHLYKLLIIYLILSSKEAKHLPVLIGIKCGDGPTENCSLILQLGFTELYNESPLVVTLYSLLLYCFGKEIVSEEALLVLFFLADDLTTQSYQYNVSILLSP